MMMKVLVNSRFLSQNISGVQRFAIEISRGLKKNYNNIEFLSPAKIIHKEIAKELNVITVGKSSSHLWEQFELPLFIKKNYSSQPFILVNLANSAPILIDRNLITIHDLTVIKYSSSYSFLYATFYKIIFNIIIKKALHIFTVSESSKRDIVEKFHLRPAKITVVYNAVAKIFINNISESNENFNLPIKEKYILTVSMFNPLKNLHRLLQAFEMLEKKPIKLIIVGGHYKSFKKIKEIEKYRTNPDIIFLGQLNDVQKLVTLYKHAELFVFPSIYESFGIPTLEAMACGCPVVVSRAGALPEVCEDAAIYIEDPFNVITIKNAMQSVLNNSYLKNKLRILGFEQVKKFRWERSVQILLGKITSIQ